ncbi:MAG: hypothetical protein M1445_14140 [Bacteroidetes bacterium]|nr:hypothetical protein [Bacteroidota bacterium]MCL6101419.1 hypothetical protein [Bacteroidota bacterium]
MDCVLPDPKWVLVISQLGVNFGAMYFKVSMRTNPATERYSGYYRLVGGYRNHSDGICHRTILNAGYLDELTTDQLNLIQKIQTAKVANHDSTNSIWLKDLSCFCSQKNKRGQTTVLSVCTRMPGFDIKFPLKN